MVQVDIDVIGNYLPKDRAMAAFHAELKRQNQLAYVFGGERQQDLGTKKILVDGVETIGDMVDKIEAALAALGPDATIRRCRIFGHSGENLMAISPLEANLERTRQATTDHDMSRSIQLVRHPGGGGVLNEPNLVKLRDCFASGGWAELHA